MTVPTEPLPIDVTATAGTAVVDVADKLDDVLATAVEDVVDDLTVVGVGIDAGASNVVLPTTD